MDARRTDVKVGLYDWGPSPFCMKVRAVLERKGIPYTRLPALSHVWEIRRRGRVGKVPALDIDGEFLVDSTNIAHALEARFPEPRIIPEDPRARALCHALEDWCDESLYFIALYYHWHEPSGRRQARKYFSKTLLGRLMFWPYLARIERQLRGHGTSRKTPDLVRADLERNLDAVEAMLADKDFLLGDVPLLCDYALASQLLYLSFAASMRDVLNDRPHARAFLARLPEVHR